ncbi:amidohydrolase family protein [Bryobacter aggregatus]|uniref:amidohydrolase family protein n=1 Tax=Bryobacter aggregatus TaxID=360054 RepID=UPI00068FC55F|nr:amidohydrolase family protein [Bryobacter aggregatus]
MNRRLFLSAASAAFAQDQLPLKDFEPRSMLRVPQTAITEPAYPVIDFHTHLSFAAKSENGVSLTPERRYLVGPEELLPVMDRKKLKTMVNLTGGYQGGLKDCVAKYDKAHPGRFLTFTEPAWARIDEPGYDKLQVQLLEEAKSNGARGIKVLKTLGLYLREKVTTGKLVKIDDPRFDPMWDAAGRLGLPIAIHVSDPSAFFTPTDRNNERFEELNNHPDWSFNGKDFPSNDAILEARNRVFARHPKTTFVALHVGNYAEDLANVSAALDKYPNMNVELAARIGELGRQPRTARRFIEKYQDRVLFGTDAVPRGVQYPQQLFGDKLYEIYYRFLETEDEYFDYAPAPVPPQGRWRIYGLGLPKPILKKIYYNNAARVIGLARI